jgi:hypothetical protein
MPAPTLVTLALLVWTLGAGVYTAQLWRARGVTDQGLPGLLGLLLGSALMAWALIDAAAPLAVCALLPGAGALALLGVKLAHRMRTRWRRPPSARPAMLSRVPAPWPVVDGSVRHAPTIPDPPWEFPEDPRRAEQARAATMAKLFG